MPNQDLIFSVNTLVGCKFHILKGLAKSHSIGKSYRKKYLITKTLSFILTGLSFIDQLRYQSLSKNLEIKKDPIYILGHWRSGTTLLHNLLCCHKNISYPTTYQTVFPNNMFFLSGLIKIIMTYYMPKKRLVDGVDMHVDFPQEEDFALGNEAGFSFYYWFYFPADYQRVTDKFLTLSSKNALKSQEYKRAYEKFIKRSLQNIGGDQYIAKNPPNMARIPFLLDMFPKSRFIYIERNPYEVLQSTFKFHKSFLKTLQLQDFDDETLWEFILQTYVLTYNKYQESKHLIPSENLVELRYENLIADPEKVYKSLHKGIISDLETDQTKLKSVLQTNRNHSANAYNFDKNFIDRVNSALGGIIEKQGYQVL